VGSVERHDSVQPLIDANNANKTQSLRLLRWLRQAHSMVTHRAIVRRFWNQGLAIISEGMSFDSGAFLKNSGSSSCRADGSRATLRTCRCIADWQVGFREMLVNLPLGEEGESAAASKTLVASIFDRAANGSPSPSGEPSGRGLG
jgi:hypothetical protein